MIIVADCSPFVLLVSIEQKVGEYVAAAVGDEAGIAHHAPVVDPNHVAANGLAMHR
jgi:hypothetical protein